MSVLLIMTLLWICWLTCVQPSIGVNTVFMSSLLASPIIELVGVIWEQLLQPVFSEMQPFPLLPHFIIWRFQAYSLKQLCPVLLRQRPVAKQNAVSPVHIFYLKAPPGFAFLCDKRSNTKQPKNKAVLCSHKMQYVVLHLITHKYFQFR